MAQNSTRFEDFKPKDRFEEVWRLALSICGRWALTSTSSAQYSIPRYGGQPHLFFYVQEAQRTIPWRKRYMLSLFIGAWSESRSFNLPHPLAQRAQEVLGRCNPPHAVLGLAIETLRQVF